MSYRFDDYAEDYIAHFGIVGMKWGIRRYQNKDGSLTAEGRRRYNEDGTPKTKAEIRRYDALHAKTAKQLYKNRKYLSDKELAEKTQKLRDDDYLYEKSGAKKTKEIVTKVALTAVGVAAVAGAAYLGKRYWDKHKDEIMHKAVDTIKQKSKEAAVSTANKSKELAKEAVKDTGKKIVESAQNVQRKAASSVAGKAYVNAVNTGVQAVKETTQKAASTVDTALREAAATPAAQTYRKGVETVASGVKKGAETVDRAISDAGRTARSVERARQAARTNVNGVTRNSHRTIEQIRRSAQSSKAGQDYVRTINTMRKKAANSDIGKNYIRAVDGLIRKIK